MNELHSIVFWISLLPSLIFFGYIIRRYVAALRTRPNIAKQDIVYQERTASGVSQKNALTKLGGARGCLRLVVTRDLLWITSWFPFSVLAAAYDLVHVIPLRRISLVQPAQFFGSDTLLLSYTDSLGKSHTLRLIPKNQERFLSAIQFRPDQGNATGAA
jgi:hypothetical protein